MATLIPAATGDKILSPASLPTSLRASIGLHVGAAALLVGVPAMWPWALGTIALNHLVLLVGGMSPRCTLLGPNLRRLPIGIHGRITLTFDDGPDPAVTPRVLDLLDEHGARASFFCIGARARAHPLLVREIARRGHSVENHTDRHPHYFAALPPRLVEREIVTAQISLAELAGRSPRFFRAPMGLRSPFLQPILARHGLALVSWTRRARDGVSGDARAAAQRLHKALAARDLLMLHDGQSARTPDGRAIVLTVLPALLKTLADQGLSSVSLSEALAPAGSASAIGA